MDGLEFNTAKGFIEQVSRDQILMDVRYLSKLFLM